MSIQIKINKLGPISNSSIEIKPFMIFSGNSGLGKSYTAFLVHYIKAVLNFKGAENTRLAEFVKKRSDNLNLVFNKSEGEVFSFSILELCKFLKEDFKTYLHYLIGSDAINVDIDIDLGIPNEEIKISYKETIEDEGGVKSERKRLFINEFSALLPENSLLEFVGYNSIIGRYISAFVSIYFLDEFRKTLFFPPSRGGFVTSSFSSLKAVTANSGIYQEFVNDMEYLLQPASKEFTPNPAVIDSLSDILGGTIINEKGSLSYEFNGQKIPITAAASSIKELAPLFLALRKDAPEDLSILFEEPEAHIHPELQVKVANLLALLVNLKANIQVTTHSDYLLTQINNLIKLHYIKQKLGDAEYNQLCDEQNINGNLTLDPDLVNAYFFEKQLDGSVIIKNQEINNGIPFDTFSKVTRDNIKMSFKLDNLIEEIGYDS